MTSTNTPAPAPFKTEWTEEEWPLTDRLHGALTMLQSELGQALEAASRQRAMQEENPGAFPFSRRDELAQLASHIRQAAEELAQVEELFGSIAAKARRQRTFSPGSRVPPVLDGDWEGAVFHGVSFRGVLLTASLRGATFVNCKLDGVSFADCGDTFGGGPLDGVVFIGCDPDKDAQVPSDGRRKGTIRRKVS